MPLHYYDSTQTFLEAFSPVNHADKIRANTMLYEGLLSFLGSNLEVSNQPEAD